MSSYNPHVDAPPIRARYTGQCACCKANYSPGRIIYYSTAREGWVIAMPHDSAGLRVETDDKPERKQPFVRRKPLAKPLNVVCGVCVLDVDECMCNA